MLGHTKHEFKTTVVKQKDYVEVKERVKYLAHEYPNPYSIQTEYQYIESRLMWIVKATLTIYYDDKQLVFNGLAQEIEATDAKKVNHTSALENAETSAIGRACAAAGIGVDHAIASADEVHKALNREKRQEEEKPSKSNGQAVKKEPVEVRPSEKVEDLKAKLKALLEDELIKPAEREKALEGIETYSESKLLKYIDGTTKLIDDRLMKLETSKK